MLEMQPRPGLPDGIAKEIIPSLLLQNYTHATTLSHMLDSQVVLEDERCASAYNWAFLKLATQVQSTFLVRSEESVIGRMPDLCTRFVALLQDEGITIAEYRTSNLKRRLQKHFGDKLLFFSKLSVCRRSGNGQVTTASVRQVLLENVAASLHKESRPGLTKTPKIPTTPTQ